MASVGNRIKHAWNAFLNQSPEPDFGSYGPEASYGVSYGAKPDRLRLRIANERSIIASIYCRMAVDIASSTIRHVRLDDHDRFLEEIDSGINECLTVEANIDQAASAFLMDLSLTLFEEGVLAVVPVETTLNPNVTGSFDIKNWRVGRIVRWFPKHVRVSLYNELTGRKEEVTLEKRFVAIIENPFYPVMNEPNSTLQRLLHKLRLLDSVDEQSSSGKLDMIIQLPYTIKTEAKREQAEQRRKDIEFQLRGSQYGIAYTDGTEKITQLNRPLENNLLKQVEYLMEMLYSQLGITAEIMNGTADEKAMLNYHNRTIDPILKAIREEFNRKFLTKTARTQKQSIVYYRDPFRFVPIDNIAEIADKFTRNEILSSNEVRQIIGFKPALDPKADELRNSNMPQSELGPTVQTDGTPVPNTASATPEEEADIVDAAFNEVDKELDAIFKDLGVEE